MTLSERINELFQKFNVNLKTEEIEVNLEAQAVLDNGTIIYTDADSFDEGAEVYILNEEGEKIPLPEGEYELEDGSKMSIGEGGKVKSSPNKGKDGKDGRDGDSEGDSSEGGDGTSSAPAQSAPKSGRAPKKDPPKRDPAKKDPPKNQLPVKKKKSAQEMLEEEDKKEELNEVEVMEMLVERFPDLDKEMASAIASAVAEIYAPEVEVVDAEDEKDEEMKHTPDHKEDDKMYSEQEQLLTELKAQLESQEAELTELKTQAASEGVKRVKSTARKTEPVDLTTLSTEERIKALYNQFNK